MAKKTALGTFGRNLRSIRERKNLTLRALSLELGVHYSEIYRWETTDQRPRPDNENKLRTFFGVASFDLPGDEFDALTGVYAHPHITELYEYEDEFAERIKELATNAKSFVHYTRLCESVSREDTLRPIEFNDPNFVERLITGSIAFHGVEVFFQKQRLIEALADLSRFEKGYFCNYFRAAPMSIPTLNIRSYDDKHFIIGGFHERRSPHTKESALLFDGRQPMAGFLKEYWNVLWSQSKQLVKSEQQERVKDIISGLDIFSMTSGDKRDAELIIIEANRIAGIPEMTWMDLGVPS